MKPRWLDRALFRAPFFTLCTTERQFQGELKSRLKLPSERWPSWLAAGNAATHLFEYKGNRCAIVCIEVDPERDGITVAGLLVHEAVHVWQEAREWHGETSPSSELEAYSIQAISQQLMDEYARQVKL